ncbi:MAG: NAD(P)-dependent alcohol dehydrogenase [Lautropia sp.]
MKAAVFARYGGADVVSIAERPTPTPGPDQVLIEVVATTVNSADWRLRSLSVPAGFGLPVRLFMGLTRPRRQILGLELAGRIAAVGGRVRRFAVGDEVVAFPGSRLGAHAAFVALDAGAPIVPKPPALPWDEAAALCFGGTAALDFLVNRGKVQRGEKVLINGASGTVGTMAVQLARHAGAEVTAVCSADAADLVRTLGATRVVDHRRERFHALGLQWDVIMDLVGNAGWSTIEHCLRPGGRLLMVVASMAETLKALRASRSQGRRCIAGTAREHADDVARLVALAAEGAIRPVIHARFALDDIVEAHRLLDAGHKRGSLVVRVREEAFDAAHGLGPGPDGTLPHQSVGL